MTAILFSHVASILIPYDRHMAKLYAYCMVSIWQPYGYIPYGFHMDTIRPAYGLAIWNTYGVSGANHIYAHMLAI